MGKIWSLKWMQTDYLYKMKEANMRIIITGAGGFLAQHLIKRFAENKSITLCALTSQYEKLEKQFRKEQNINIYDKDAIQQKQLILSEKDILINCAFPRNQAGTAFAEGLLYIQTVLLAAAKQGVGAVINISSQSVYDPERSYPAAEHSPLCLNTVYAVGKYTSELLTESICTAIPYTNLRMASLIGPGFEQRITNKLAKAALLNGELTVMENKQQFGFLDIEDAVDGIENIIGLDAMRWSGIYNLGGDHTYSLLEIAEVIADILWKKYGRKIQIRTKKDTQVLNTSLNCSLIKKETGYKQNRTLEYSMSKIIEQLAEL